MASIINKKNILFSILILLTIDFSFANYKESDTIINIINAVKAVDVLNDQLADLLAPTSTPKERDKIKLKMKDILRENTSNFRLCENLLENRSLRVTTFYVIANLYYIESCFYEKIDEKITLNNIEFSLEFEINRINSVLKPESEARDIFVKWKNGIQANDRTILKKTKKDLNRLKLNPINKQLATRLNYLEKKKQ